MGTLGYGWEFLRGKPLIKISLDKQIKTQQIEAMMSELARNTLTETKQRNQIEDKIDGDLKEAWQAAIAWSIIIMVVGIQVIILILVS